MEARLVTIVVDEGANDGVRGFVHVRRDDGRRGSGDEHGVNRKLPARAEIAEEERRNKER